jgi:hypothetical protein
MVAGVGSRLPLLRLSLRPMAEAQHPDGFAMSALVWIFQHRYIMMARIGVMIFVCRVAGAEAQHPDGHGREPG